MAGRQRIDRVRREYNQWAANETLEDYALRFTAKSARHWSAGKVGQTALGAVSFLALEAIGGSITLNYGFVNATLAIAAVGLLIFATAFPICFYAAKFGVDIDLLTRGAGFGYIGSTVTSLIYASFTFIFFAIESVILAMAFNLCIGLPLSLGYLLAALVVIPLVTHGISTISRFQVWTQPIFVVMNVVAVAAVAFSDTASIGDWRAFAGENSDLGSFHLVAFGAAASVAIALIVQVGEQVDFLRFLPDRKEKPGAWWLALVTAGPGWILVGCLKLLAGSFLAVYLFRHGVARALAADPPQMYASAFQILVGSKPMALALTCVFVIVCQLKINVTNAYAGSIAWSNFFARLTHTHPGRVVWLVFNVAVAVLVMELGVYRAIEQTLAFYSSVAVAWVGALVADLVINKPLGLSPPTIEFKRAHLYDINPVGTLAMVLATLVATVSQLGLAGPDAKALAPFLALLTSLVSVPLIALATKSRFYLARQPDTAWKDAGSIACCICENAFEPEDMASCPAYAGPICSLCCSLDARCHDLCKPHGRAHDQLVAGLNRTLSARLRRYIRPHVVQFVLAFGLSMLLVSMVLGLIGLQIGADPRVDHAALVFNLWKVFASLLIVVGVVCWLFVLVQMSRRAAQDETLRQTQLLMEEIEAHERTDAALKRAKEVAEAANFAKSRYVVGLSHELRTPLNTIMGYAQLLERDAAMPAKPRGQIAVVRRSANHLSSLIDGLLDISKIEAGKLDLSKDEVATEAFLKQIVDMFAVQAAAKDIEFEFDPAPNLPPVVATDEKRLRQITINLLSNAIKFTQSGRIGLKITYRNQVAEIIVSDTGPGIAEKDLVRIFEPFERLKSGATEPGTGLGLTICKLLAGVMGGDIGVSSQVGVGSQFKLRLFMPRINDAKQPATSQALTYSPPDRRTTILVADDDPTHRDMMRESLGLQGFDVVLASSGSEALDLAQALTPDLYLLDIEMPDMDGWKLAEALRSQGHVDAAIVMLSASAREEYRSAIALPFHDAFIMKPVDLGRLSDTILGLLDLRPNPREVVVPPPAHRQASTLKRPSERRVLELIQQCEIGHIRGLRETVDHIVAEDPELRPYGDLVSSHVEAMDLRGLMALLERANELTP